MIFRFAHPLALFILVIPILVFVLSRLGRWRTIPAVMLYSDVRLFDDMNSGWRVRMRRTPDVLRLIAWVLLVIALARPQGGRTQEVIRGEGVDIALALDISGSMAALDFDPQNRLQAAKSVIGDFIAGREFDRIGLVVFARDAFHQSPPTLDYEVLLRLLDEVQLAPDLLLDDGTAIGLGLASAANMLRASTAPSRIIILLTDGANNAGAIDPLTAAQSIAALGMRVYTIGVGKTGLVPILDDLGNSRLIESDLDEDTLRGIAEITNGAYFRAVDLVDLQRIYDQIDVLERSDVERQSFVRWQEQGFIWLVVGFVLLIIERLLRHTVFQTIP